MEFLILALLGLGALSLFDFGKSDPSSEPDVPEPEPESDFFLDLGAGGPAIVGTTGNDQISNDGIAALRAGSDVDELRALAGDDTIRADGGALGGMTLFAGFGDDLILSSSATTATIYGGEGDDTIRASNAVVYGGPGDDEVTMSPGSLESPATATANGGAGNDLMTAPDGQATMFGDEGNDTLRGGTASMLVGEEGDDELEVFGNFAVARGGVGDDVLRAQVRIEPLEIADVADARWNPFDSGLLLRGGQGNDGFFVEIDPRAELDPARSDSIVLATINDFTPGTDALTVRVADGPLPFASTQIFGPPPVGPSGALLPSGAPTVAATLAFAGLQEAPDGSYTDMVFATGAATHDLVVRLTGVTGLDPVQVVVSADLRLVEVPFAPAAT